MRRREFARIAAAAIPGMGMAFEACRSHGNTLDETLASPESLSLFLEREELRQVGKAYRAANPSEDDRKKLAGLVLRDGNLSPLSTGSSLSTVRDAIDGQVDRDFATGRTVIVKGWVLAATEARQCALHTLIFP
jgi:hypothetical protein